MHSRVYEMIGCLSICLSVCLSVPEHVSDIHAFSNSNRVTGAGSMQRSGVHLSVCLSPSMYLTSTHSATATAAECIIFTLVLSWLTNWHLGKVTSHLTLPSAMLKHTYTRTHAYTHTHTHLTARCPGLPRWAGTSEWQWHQLGHMQVCT